MDFMPKYYLIAGDTSQVYYFSYIKLLNNVDLFSKLSLTYRVNVTHYQNVHHPLSTLSV